MIQRPATPADFDAILALNEESVRFLSPLSHARLQQLHQDAALHEVVVLEGGELIAFVLALREGTGYDSVNYRWFAERFEQFLYVDRVVVSTAHRSVGAGRLLYEKVFAHAAASGVARVTCEYDVSPPNPASERFHASFGFREVGQQQVAGGKKTVSLQAAPVG